MTAVRVSCPHCGKNLKLRQAPVPGRRVLCSGCNRSFLPGPEAVAAAPPPPAAPPAEAVAAPGLLASSVLRPVVPPPPPIPPPPPPLPVQAGPASRRGILIGAVLGGLLLLTGSTALALHLAVRSDGQREQPALAPDSARRRDDTSPPPRTTPTDTPNDPAPPRNDDPDDPAPPRADVRPPAPARPREPRPPTIEPPAPVQPTGERAGWLPRDVQELVNKAVDHGVEHLKKKQLPSGSWENHHTTGMAALPGLTLLECGVPANDPCIQKAARFVRDNAPKLATGHETYELSLALLFLDRLGDPKDRALIRTIALRLVAGQLAEGGWTYRLPLLPPEDEKKLLTFLTQTRPVGKGMDRFMELPGDRKPPDRFQRVPGPGGKLGPSVVEPGSKPGNVPGSTIPLEGKRPTKPVKEPAPKRLVRPAEVKKAIDKLPLRLRNIPAVSTTTGKAAGANILVHGTADNSNTQFATLALWAARRHGLPLERSLDLLVRRFQRSQLPDGTWKYHATPHGWGTPAMTGAGLLGLAVGHGLEADPRKKKSVKDARVDRGLRALGSQVGKPFGANINRLVKRGPRGRIIRLGRMQSPVNLYFLWTVERVGVLYHVRELDGKDWYRWGVDLLLPVQDDDGSWHQGNYPGSTRGVDTCFALLFLRRANFAADLTRRLDFVVEGKPASSLR